MNPSDAIEAIEKPLSSLPYSLSRHILEHLRKLTSHEPVIGIMGKSGAGKSSLCNALFQGEVTPVSDVHAGTREVRRFRLSGHGHSMVITDLPGVGESRDRDAEYEALYRDILPELDLVLWLIKADDRALSVDEYFWRHILHRGHQQVLFVVTQADKTEPCHEWDMAGIQPSPAQAQNIREKTEAVFRLFRPVHPVVAVSARTGWELDTLVSALMTALPDHAASPLMTRLQDELRTESVRAQAREQFTGAVDRIFDTAESVCVASVARKHYRTVWVSGDGKAVEIIDQTKLPFKFEVVALTSAEMAATAIQDMWVRGAPLIGVVAAYGIALGMNHDASDMGLQRYYDLLIKTRPTAINLKWALDRMIDTLKDLCVSERKDVAWALAAEIAEEDVALCEQIGLHGAEVIREIAQKKPAGSVVNILTHCNAGWLATVDWGTALSPIYKAHENGIPVHVWVDETRPRNQGGLTAFELGSHGIPHTLIADNAGGHLMQHGDVDLCIVGTDRTTARGDVCNKIGTYLKALAAHDNHVPFYVALPSPTIDWTIEDGKSIPIEQRDGKEQSHVYGINPQGELSWVNTAPEGTRCGNYAFDVTPARYITGFITERGVCAASKSALADMFADLKSKALQGEQH
ncbi:TPA: S-methyl-5-thioribose-1-phosphate isomerase [Escherichia coli]|nr:S-methyl-5-thioribose-1-phosphate isomerase [Escherichia coli]EFA4792993.1 S-methyl-5-thioribose-1-phosphate isomerase [Escherichia coli]EFM3167119.1 S-methyl-5-thioribose-1-phosphate isomerase [Escherichia coli]EFO4106053.1 S-methyl-5-thioribose-1-phosphate isomerase [Escherichia coli]EFS3090084.1 S-methyl-5-thioribose-1-phosphate isomerase [Escherichia coli]